VHRLLADPRIASFAVRLGATTVKRAVDDVLRAARSNTQTHGSDVATFDALVAELVERLAAEESETMLDVLNATGVLLHTNLGRAPLPAEALDAMRAIGDGYSNLEFELGAGVRGSRYERVSSLLRATTGAQDGLVVNNCAAAVLLILDTFARGREVIVSRNALVEIGGGFRLPDVLERSGARLVEVGTTNRVYLRDFERALGIDTALLFRTHASNFSMQGFVADVEARELAALGRRVGVPVVEDLGSGALIDLAAYGLPHERTVQEAIADGLDLVAFSGDKLLGGPQAGIIVGRSAPIARMRANPMLRALRVDKTTLAALAATLRLYDRAAGVARIPLYAMLAATVTELEQRAHALVAAAGGADSALLSVVATQAHVGGGALPLAALPSAGVSIVPAGGDPNAFAATLRRARPALVGRVDGDAVVLDLRTIPPERDGELAEIVAAALRG